MVRCISSSSEDTEQTTPHLDGPNCFFSFPAPNNSYNPILDPANDVASPVVSDWISGFWSHGTTIDTLVQRTPVDDPPPTVRTMGLDDIRNCVYIPSDATGNSDKRLLLGGHFAGVFADLWNDAFAISPEPSHARKALRDVEVRVVWCERSVWEMVLAGWNIKTEMEDARLKGRTVRNVSAVCLRGGNHFVSVYLWLEERTLRQGSTRHIGMTRRVRCGSSWRPRVSWRREMGT